MCVKPRRWRQRGATSTTTGVCTRPWAKSLRRSTRPGSSSRRGWPVLRSGMRPSLRPGQRRMPSPLSSTINSHRRWHRKWGQATPSTTWSSPSTLGSPKTREAKLMEFPSSRSTTHSCASASGSRLAERHVVSDDGDANADLATLPDPRACDLSGTGSRSHNMFTGSGDRDNPDSKVAISINMAAFAAARRSCRLPYVNTVASRRMNWPVSGSGRMGVSQSLRVESSNQMECA